jgi:hypothetical protein
VKNNRRELLSVAAAILALILITPENGLAIPRRGGSSVQQANPAQPAPAATWGFNTNTFFDDFLNLNGFDINATFAPGYNWYMRAFQWPGANTGQQYTVPANSVSTSNSILTINTTTTGPSPYGGWMGTTGYAGAAATPQLAGKAFKNGGYFEASIAFDPSSIPSWPGSPTPRGMAFWLQDNQVGLDTSLQQNTGLPYGIEFDIFEWYLPTNALDNNIWAWTSYNSSTSQGSNIYTLSSYTTFHKYGMLWVPAAKNAGTGLIKFYVDGVQKGGTVSYTSSDPLYYADTSVLGLNLMIGSMPGWPMQVDYVTVWQ